MLILKILFACLIVGGVGSLFVWRQKRFAKLAQLYFGMLWIGIGFYSSLSLLLLLQWLLSDKPKNMEQYEAQYYTWAGIILGSVFTASVLGLLVGLSLGAKYSNSVQRNQIIIK